MDIKNILFFSKFIEVSTKIPPFFLGKYESWISSKNTPLFTNFRTRMCVVSSMSEGAGRGCHLLKWSFVDFMFTMAWFYAIYSYVISKWRLIRLVEINQYDITMATHYDITMGNDVARHVHCEITMDNDIARDIHCDVTMSNDVAMCTYHVITMHNELLWTFSIMYSLLYA